MAGPGRERHLEPSIREGHGDCLADTPACSCDEGNALFVCRAHEAPLRRWNTNEVWTATPTRPTPILVRTGRTQKTIASRLDLYGAGRVLRCSCPPGCNTTHRRGEFSAALDRLSYDHLVRRHFAGNRN